MGYNTEYGIVADELTEILQNRLAGIGKSDVDRVIREVLKETDTVNRLKDIILSQLIGGATSERVRNYIVSESFALSVTYGGIKPKLSGTIHKLGNDAQQILSNTVKQSLTDGESWTKAMYNLRNQELTIGDLPDYIKKAMSGSKADQQRAREMVRKLSSRTSPTTAVKKAYGRILDAVESDNKKALDKAVDSAINNKIKYNTARIARTEYAYASAGASQKMIDEDGDIIGWVSRVSDNRPEGFRDICDMYNGQFFPKSVPILQPYHIQCMCSAEMVYKGKKMRKEWSEDVSQKWLDANPDLAKMMVRGKPKRITPDMVIGYKNPKTAEKIKYGNGGQIEIKAPEAKQPTKRDLLGSKFNELKNVEKWTEKEFVDIFDSADDMVAQVVTKNATLYELLGANKSGSYHRGNSNGRPGTIRSEKNNITLMHEYAHHIDHVNNLVDGDWGKEFSRARYFDAQGKTLASCIEDMKTMPKEFKYRHAISDIYDAMTNGKMYENGFSGHGKRYYSNKVKDSKGKEIFAQMFSFYGTDGFVEMEKRFPNMTKMFSEWIKKEAGSE